MGFLGKQFREPTALQTPPSNDEHLFELLLAVL